MPFAVLLVATAALIVVIRRWETVGSAARAENRANPAADLNDAQRLTLERVEREMREDD
jgi:hypothetical protein